MINLSKLAAVARATPKTKTAKVAPASALDKLNQEKMSRRAALRRIGMTSGIAVLGLLTIDDLARVASQKLEQNELTRGIAKDFRSAGVAFATSPGEGYYVEYNDDDEDCERDQFGQCICDTNQAGEVIWLANGQCAPKKRIPIPPDCKNPKPDGNAPNCNDCVAAYNESCRKKARKKYPGWTNWVPRNNAIFVCDQAVRACNPLCIADDSVEAVGTFADCYRAATSNI